MADQDRDDDGPSLELPSFFGRKKKARPEPDAAPEASSQPVPEPDSEPEPELAPDPVSDPEPEPETSSQPEPAPESEPEPAPEPEPVAVPPVAPRAVRAEPVAPVAVPTNAPAPGPAPVAEPVAESRPERERPALPGLQAALVVGAAIGLLAVLLTFGSLKLCEVVRGTDSCGGPGLLLLVATLVVLTYAGAWLLRAFGIDDPGSTSFLAVGLLTVVAVLFLLDVVYSWWMVIVVPLVGMATYALSWWVTTRFVDVE
ncbi:hypothetical protein [Nocardioides currus]|uniref:Uncharacterized protein n=1 Tax=Nocardioides currus TaxID=2133958 RepID=A0A2R7Z2Q7_9ACTN|nr:hypothetical protein [Nocardioides currus]PUA82872.1 hypothetical protein C7S10_03980 [Nocardioides currus]